SSGPPRPHPARRRASSAAISADVMDTPAGRPSSTATRAGPCDSPAVTQRSMRPSLPNPRRRSQYGRLLGCREAAGEAGRQAQGPTEATPPHGPPPCRLVVTDGRIATRPAGSQEGAEQPAPPTHEPLTCAFVDAVGPCRDLFSILLACCLTAVVPRPGRRS